MGRVQSTLVHGSQAYYTLLKYISLRGGDHFWTNFNRGDDAL